MSELPIQTNSHIFTNKNGNTLMREFVGIFSKSRHLYDLAQSMSTDIAKRAIINNELWNIAHHHRDLFTSMSEVDYTPDIRKCIKLLPLNEVIVNWHNNYEDMQLSMTYGEKTLFEDLTGMMESLNIYFIIKLVGYDN